MTTDDHVGPSPHSLPWGQLFVGSVVGGTSLWMIALNLTSTEPSAMLAGVAAAYEAWRDWLIAPLERALQIKLSPIDRDVLIFDVVMVGVLVRTAVRYPAEWAYLGFLVLLVSVGSFLKLDDPVGVATLDDVLKAAIARTAIICALLIFIAPLAGIIGKIMEPVKELDDLTSPAAMLGLWNAIALAATAGALLLVDWAARASTI